MDNRMEQSGFSRQQISRQDISQAKKQIRKAVLKIRDNLSEEERQRSSLLLTERLIGHQWFYLSQILLCFVSFGSEIDTAELLREALAKGKDVYVPRVEGETMHFYRIDSLSDLKPGYRGILEPDGTSPKYEYKPEAAEQTLMLMPGVAFDPMKHRIGYGKGFYDRYLEGKEILKLHTIGIGFRCQLVEQIPCEEQDISPYQVILT